MNKRHKWFELYLPSEYKHWCLYFSLPSSGREAWNGFHRMDGEERIYRSWLTIGFYKFFFLIYLWKVKPFDAQYGTDTTKRYGFTFFERSVHLHFSRTWVKRLPWDWEIVRHDLLYPDGRVYWRNTFHEKNTKHIYWHDVFSGTPDYDELAKGMAKYIALTHYTKDGRIQSAKIRLTGSEREWRWWWLTLIPLKSFRWNSFPWKLFPRRVSRVVDCSSNRELGARAETWKGGISGWSCKWHDDESMERAFWHWYEDWNGR